MFSLCCSGIQHMTGLDGVGKSRDTNVGKIWTHWESNSRPPECITWHAPPLHHMPVQSTFMFPGLPINRIYPLSTITTLKKGYTMGISGSSDKSIHVAVLSVDEFFVQNQISAFGIINFIPDSIVLATSISNPTLEIPIPAPGTLEYCYTWLPQIWASALHGMLPHYTTCLYNPLSCFQGYQSTGFTPFQQMGRVSVCVLHIFQCSS